MTARAIGFTEARRGDGNQEIEKIFSPEFRNRLDEIVRFDPLPEDVMERVVDKFVLELEAQLAERKIAVTLRPAARKRLAEKGYDPDFGARPLGRVIQQELKNPLTDEVLFGRLTGGGRVEVDVDEEGNFDFAFPDSKDEGPSREH